MRRTWFIAGFAAVSKLRDVILAFGKSEQICIGIECKRTGHQS
jgi:hypothetical protein